MRDSAINKRIGRNLRTIRLGAGVTQKALANRIGVTFQQIQKYEHGINRVSAATLFASAQALGCGIDDFFAGLCPHVVGGATTMSRNPILFVTDAGFGETPIPPDALMHPGADIAGKTTDGDAYAAKCVAVVPVGVPVEYAMADQATPKQPRPLMLRERKAHRETLYLIQRDSDCEPSIFTHSAIAEGLRLANEAAAPGKKLTRDRKRQTPSGRSRPDGGG